MISFTKRIVEVYMYKTVKDGCREWPVPGASTFFWKGKPLAYMPFVYEHGTHFVLPESLLRMALPVGLKFVLRFIFRAAKNTLMRVKQPE